MRKLRKSHYFIRQITYEKKNKINSPLTRLGDAASRSVRLRLHALTGDPLPQLPRQDVAAIADKLGAKVPAGQDHPLFEAHRLQQLAEELVRERVALRVHDLSVGKEERTVKFALNFLLHISFQN